MKWLVFGSKGWIGNQVLDALRARDEDQVVEAAEVRADDEEGVMELLKKTQPDRVISLIGRTHGPGFSTIDYLEQKGKLVENVRDNLYGPLVLAMACQTAGVHLTYLGTGCIFTYDDRQGGFTETDKPNFFGSSYSIVKGFTDRLMNHALFKECVLNVRIRMPITADRSARNFITKISSYEKICSIPNSMTVLPELLPIMIDMAAKQAVGTINLTNPGVISHNEILGMYKDLVDPTFTWQNFSQEEQKQILLSDRSNNCLDTRRLEDMYPHVRNIKDAVRAVLEEMKHDFED